ncbi:indole-3-glycerol phosphate synthase TrpC [Ferruginibacter sp. HRS2-29]|uniref:indole-3-glycerol phosphate synthase TrpC n=1 Tax=Ferruginibacter sp. HRS2-29 TaxID=2487334 RepID=UPI0020CE9B96|nr:indole-3-glycerol phosphate synthase TrpC [Ferruginibacter sp. HRS2-29]MCP9752478.1 indole-3-glycerol phosphate synthase TrpC [Ferruginibacter sp. HRS2-29]
MKNILDEIVAYKREEVEARRTLVPEKELMQSIHFERTCISLKNNLLEEGATGIIAEFKRRSPSKGYIHQFADVAKVTGDYTVHGASGLSVLTDHHFFGGSTEDLAVARNNHIPILRKDFMIDPYQVLAAKAMGADVILLIAACLTKQEVRSLAGTAKQLGMQVLLELHEEEELEHLCEEIDMVGINNRSLKSFKVDINRSLQLAEALPSGMIKIAESGIDDPATIRIFREAGYKGFLIGEHFMKEQDPGAAFERFVKNIKK